MRFFRRRSADGGGDGTLVGPDAGRALKALRQASDSDERFVLRPHVERLWDEAPTRDIRLLKERGVDAGSFYDDELAPNWDGLTRAERAAKVEAFARLARALGDDAGAGDMGPVVRTKLLVLAWAHDEAYGDENFLDRVEKHPERFEPLAAPS